MIKGEDEAEKPPADGEFKDYVGKIFAALEAPSEVVEFTTDEQKQLAHLFREWQTLDAREQDETQAPAARLRKQITDNTKKPWDRSLERLLERADELRPTDLLSSSALKTMVEHLRESVDLAYNGGESWFYRRSLAKPWQTETS
jgi:hypothetical protein